MRTSVIILILLLLCGLFAGCYTMLVHPTTQGSPADWHTTTRHCSDCHGSADYYYWHYPNYFNWYWDYPSYRSYYYDPWWWRDYWYWYDDDGSGGTPVEKGERHLFQPVERPTVGSEGVPKIIEGETKVVPQPPPSDVGNIQQDKPQQEQKTTQKAESGRHLWRPVRRPSTSDDSDKPKAKEEKAEEKK